MNARVPVSRIASSVPASIADAELNAALSYAEQEKSAAGAPTARTGGSSPPGVSLTAWKRCRLPRRRSPLSWRPRPTPV